MNIIKLNTSKEIFDVLTEFDLVFPRALSSRVKSLNDYAEKLLKNSFVYIAKDKEIAGFFVLYANDLITKIAYLSQIAVLNSYKGMGIGLELMNFCKELAINSGMEQLRLEVDIDNKTAIRFYEKFGFVFERIVSNESQYMILSLI